MRKPIHVLLAAALTLAVVGCGEDEPETSASSSTTEAGAGSSTSGEAPPVSIDGRVNDHGTETAGDELDLELDDNYFAPTYIKAEPGATLTLELENEGDVAHFLTIDSLDIDQEVKAGEKATVEISLPEEGATSFYCKLHRSLGMQGTFFFEEGDEVVTSSAGSVEDDGTGVTTGTTDPGY